MEDKSSILIEGDKETIWTAVTDEHKLSQWYVPGSPWKITKLSVGEKGTFTLMPSRHNNLSEKLPMTFTIQVLDPYDVFSLYLDGQQTTISFRLEHELNRTRVTINSAGFDQSLENLKSLVEGNDIPHV